MVSSSYHDLKWTFQLLKDSVTPVDASFVNLYAQRECDQNS